MGYSWVMYNDSPLSEAGDYNESYWSIKKVIGLSNSLINNFGFKFYL